MPPRLTALHCLQRSPRLTALHCRLQLPLEGTVSMRVCVPCSCFAGLPVVACTAALLLAGHNGACCDVFRAALAAFPWCLFILHACFAVLPCLFFARLVALSPLRPLLLCRCAPFCLVLLLCLLCCPASLPCFDLLHGWLLACCLAFCLAWPCTASLPAMPAAEAVVSSKCSLACGCPAVLPCCLALLSYRSFVCPSLASSRLFFSGMPALLY